MLRGRPRKNPLPPEGDAKEAKPKRKYTRRKKPEELKTDDNTIIKPEAKKRGRKRGRRKKEQELMMKPEEVMDYMIRNFPDMKLEKIKYKVVSGLKLMKELGENRYVLDKFTYNDESYYYDDKNTILNADAKFVGYFIDQDDGTKKIYFLKPKGRDERNFEQIIAEIEGIKLNDDDESEVESDDESNE